MIDGNGTYAIHYDSNVTGDIVNDVGATIKNKSAAATVIMDSIKLTGKIDNSGTIVNSGSGVAVDLFGSQVTGGLINRAGGVIQASGTNAVSLSHNTFTIEGGQVIGNTVGASTSTVNFNLASVTPATFNPFVNSFGFNTDGNFTLVTTGTSAINVNTGALLVDFNNNLQADSITVGSNGVLDFFSTSTVTLGTGKFTNNGLTIFDTGHQTINGDFRSQGAGNLVGFVVRPFNGGIFFPLVDVSKTATLDSNARVKIFNSYNGYTPGSTNNTILTTGTSLTLDGNAANALNVNAAMDTGQNTATLAYQAHSDGKTGKNLQLDVLRTAYDALSHGFTANENAAGGALETLGNNNTTTGPMSHFLGLLDSLTSAGRLENALKQTLPIANGAALYGSMVGFDSMLQSIDTRLANFGGQYAGAGDGSTGLSGAAGGLRNGVWLRAGGGVTASLSADWERRDGFSGVSGFAQVRIGF